MIKKEIIKEQHDEYNRLNHVKTVYKVFGIPVYIITTTLK